MPDRDSDPISEARRQWADHGWGDAADGMAMVTSLTRAHQLLMERIETVLRPFDLTFARYELLRVLAFSRAGAMPMTRLGSLLMVHPTSVTSAVQRLEKQGFVRRSRGASDRRVVLASITEAGREAVEPATVALNAAVFANPGIAPKDVSTLLGLLGTLRLGAGDLDEG